MAHPGGTLVSGEMEIPLEEYLTSIDESIRGTAAVPQWYIAVDGGRIIAGAGVIANDFHDRKDLTPNVCALYVEPELRRRGIAGHLLAHICKDMAAKGIGTLPHHGTHLVPTNATVGNTSAWCRAMTGNRCGCIKKDTSL